MLCYKYAAQQMVKQGRGGRLIGASSAAGREGKQPSSVVPEEWSNAIITLRPLILRYAHADGLLRLEVCHPRVDAGCR